MSECIYCRGPANSKEHIVPKALGETRTTGHACKTCNHGILSILDRELASKSPLSLVIAQELGRHPEYAWDVDHDDGNLLLEGRPNKSFDSFILWPQMIIDDGIKVRGDAEDIEQLGSERFFNVFVKHLRRAFDQYNHSNGTKGFFFDEMPWIGDDERYRYPPRVFARDSVASFCDGMTFICRYLNGADKHRILSALENWNPATRFRNMKTQLGTMHPVVHLHFNCEKVVRALTKIGINLVAHVCERTTVSWKTFEATVAFVTGRIGASSRLIHESGFTYASQLTPLDCPKHAHKFRVLYDDRRKRWLLYCAFFGGRIGAKATFLGAHNLDGWSTADVTVPLRSKNWQIKKSSIYQPITMSVEWQNMAKIVPSIALFNPRSRTSVVRIDPSKATRMT